MADDGANQDRREIELKYRLTDGSLPALMRAQDQLLDGYWMGPRRNQDNFDAYWDTASYSLIRAGFGLRTRWQEGSWLVALKSLDPPGLTGLADRLELEREADRDRLAGCPMALLTLGDLLAPFQQQNNWPPDGWNGIASPNTENVRPLVLLDQKREKRDLYWIGSAGRPAPDLARDHQAIGEVSLDTIRILPLPPYNDQPTAQRPWRIEAVRAWAGTQTPVGVLHELEIEATGPASAETHAELADAMVRAYALQPAGRGKGETAFAVLNGAPVDGVSTDLGLVAETEVDVAAQRFGRQQLAILLLNESAVRRLGDADALHKMVVATRRLRIVAEQLRPVLDEDTLRGFGMALEQSARHLGAAREVDVALSTLDTLRATHAAPARERSAGVVAAWQAEREAAYATVQRWLQSAEYDRFIVDFDTACRASMSAAGEDAPDAWQPPRQIRYVLPVAIHAAYARVRSYEVVAVPRTAMITLRALAASLARLDDLLVLAGPLLGSPQSEAVMDKCRAVQDRLDKVVADSTVRARLDAEQKRRPHLRFYRDVLSSTLETEWQTLRPLWQTLIERETRQQLALAIAHL